MNIYLVIILAALFLEFFIYNFSRYLDLKNLSINIPAEFKFCYDEKEYFRSQKYLRINTQFSYLTSCFDLFLTLLIIFSGFFNIIDLWIRSYEFSTIMTGLLFYIVLFFMMDVLHAPFSLYRTFIIEEKFGFNKTTAKTYLFDKIKAYLLIIVLGGLFLHIVLYFFENLGHNAWLFAWIIVSLFLVLVQPIFTLFIAPLFNNFTPLEDGPLKNRIKEFTQLINFPIGRIDIMDGSRRSSKANAYFSGLGKNKRIALFDTLIEQHTEDELLSIIAHEVGHYKKRHNIKGISLGVVQVGFIFFLLSLFLENRQLFEAFKMENLSIYASFLFFSLLYSPIELVMSIVINFISRKHEFEADAFAKQTIGSCKHLIDGLKKLATANLENLTPHPFTVWLRYSHPPVLYRIRVLKEK